MKDPARRYFLRKGMLTAMKTPEGVFPPKRNVLEDPARRYFLRKGMLDNNEDSRRSISSEEECSEGPREEVFP